MEIKNEFLDEELKKYKDLCEIDGGDVQNKLLIEHKKITTITYYNKIEQMREYPIDLKTLKSIIVLAVLPITINIIGVIIEKIIE